MAAASEDQEYDRIILVSNLAEDTTADVLEIFFESTKRTGGGPVEKIYMYQSHRQAVIVFHDKLGEKYFFTCISHISLYVIINNIFLMDQIIQK